MSALRFHELTVKRVNPEAAGSVAITLAETLATSDVPAGVVNLLTGITAELAPWLASHRDVNAMPPASAAIAAASSFRTWRRSSLGAVMEILPTWVLV